MPSPKTKKTEKKTYTYEEYVKNVRPKSLRRLTDYEESQARPVAPPHNVTNSSDVARPQKQSLPVR